jgi:cytochrome c oxidase assembly protein Cox11/mono/diheme cytochrome c family protein
MAPDRSRRKLGTFLTVAALLVAVGAMTTAVSYSVTLYRLFCQVTGAGGTTRRVASDTAKESDKVITVFFNTDVAPGLPWRFRPVQSSVQLRLGQDTVVFFEAENLSDQDIVGHATFNVTPDKAGPYFKKIECFCFTEERLNAHQTVEMPVDFFVDPKIADNPGTQDVDQITLSYTFFRSENPKGASDLSRFVDAPPDPEAGRKLFASQCSGCHEMTATKVGPPLAGVVGRRAGSVAGYPYSAALAKSGIVWTAETLDRWLAGPQQDVPGALMPMSIPDEATRRAIIAYLQQESTKQGADRNPAPGPRQPG